jgi:hypothetical protein
MQREENIRFLKILALMTTLAIFVVLIGTVVGHHSIAIALGGTVSIALCLWGKNQRLV